MSIARGSFSYRIDNKSEKVIWEIGKTYKNEDIEIKSQVSENSDGELVDVKIIPNKRITIKELYLSYSLEYEEKDRAFVNGYQTWTDSREYYLNESIPNLNKLVWPLLSSYGDYSFYRRNKKLLYSWTYTYVRKSNNDVLLLGSLSEKEGFTIFEHDDRNNEVRIIKDCSGLELNSNYHGFSLFISRGKEERAFDDYFKAMDIEKPKVNKTLGWTSWYNYYTNISEDIILENLEAFLENQIPIDIFQIDDGYQEKVGDWLKINNKFSNGMGAIAQRIHDHGYKAGIWLAPFICEKDSQIFKDHEDWLLRNEKGKLIKVGYNPGWSGIFYALDIYNPSFMQYLKEVFDTALNKWNYDMVKLDFLYAAALNPRKDKTRGEIMHDGMKLLRELTGDKLILGCGVPLGSAFGLVDYCRVGGDVALKWEDKLLRKVHYRERVSTVNSLISTIGRRHLNKRAFYNDPDVFILRSENQEMNSDERMTLFLINQLLGGLVFTSDNLKNYSQDELQLYKTLFRFKNSRIKSVCDDVVLRIDFEIDQMSYLALCNLTDRKQSYILEEGEYIEEFKGFKASSNNSIDLDAHASACLRRLGCGDLEQ